MNLRIHMGEEGEKMMDERLPLSRGVVEGTGRGAAGPLGRVVVVVVVRGRRRRGRRDVLVREDGGGPLAARYRRHDGPRLGLTAPPIRPSLADSLLAPAGAGHHRVRPVTLSSHRDPRRGGARARVRVLWFLWSCHSSCCWGVM
jgi:hypothetical protein